MKVRERKREKDLLLFYYSTVNFNINLKKN